MNRRDFLKLAGLIIPGILIARKLPDLQITEEEAKTVKPEQVTLLSEVSSTSPYFYWWPGSGDFPKYPTFDKD